MKLDIADIQKVLPHRFPFLLIDRVVECVPNEKLVAVKNVSVNEQFFNGHFPGEKVMPGVLILEALAQAACVYFYYSRGMEGKDLVYYLAKATVKFVKPVVPGDQLVLEVTTKKLLPKIGLVYARALVGGEIVTEAEISFSTKEV
jgi:3-hydroxyacyl-[acyl-carrier-protein] dehydratase